MTHDREIATDRAVAAYRRMTDVPFEQAALDLMASLVEWHRVYIDRAVSLDTIFQHVETTLSSRTPEHGRAAVPATYEPRSNVPLPGDPPF